MESSGNSVVKEIAQIAAGQEKKMHTQQARPNQVHKVNNHTASKNKSS